ncbi:hypothetical protein F5876DRAFT_68891 [Lentinula aff. lateritia]|uniref:Uncharacterized protein n=1 Tax=Lentinula aff. lateritia TaxID=2804960 RepID=A0ACC1TP74_9AGAR|nr:hypothetical protein F5876DRAFT_68891 [Lentinula aff. lateritia]
MSNLTFNGDSSFAYHTYNIAMWHSSLNPSLSSSNDELFHPLHPLQTLENCCTELFAAAEEENEFATGGSQISNPFHQLSGPDAKQERWDEGGDAVTGEKSSRVAIEGEDRISKGSRKVDPMTAIAPESLKPSIFYPDGIISPFDVVIDPPCHFASSKSLDEFGVVWLSIPVAPSSVEEQEYHLIYLPHCLILMWYLLQSPQNLWIHSSRVVETLQILKIISPPTL